MFYESYDQTKTIKRILRYFKGTLNMYLRYRQIQNSTITAYADADWGGDS